MRPIPKALLRKILADPWYEFCCYPDCGKQAELEHAILESGRQLNEFWAIIPCCPDHNRGVKMDKAFNRYVALSRASEDDLNKYPRSAPFWRQDRAWLMKKYGKDHPRVCL